MDKLNLVLLPGLVNDARLYQHQIAGLSHIAEAMVGDLTVADSMPALASAVLAKAPERFALVGLSMGGYTAFEIMRQAPHRVSALALLDTSARPDMPEATENRKRLMQLAEKDFDVVIDMLLPKMLHPSHLKDDARAGVFKAMARDVGKDAFVRQQRAIIGRADSRPSLQRITCPTLVLCGRDDVTTPLEVHQEIVNDISNATLTVVDECGHLSPLDQPQAVTQALQKWLVKNGRERA
jgi:pimeloyl-ACP methyl ester carboxylesterase